MLLILSSKNKCKIVILIPEFLFLLFLLTEFLISKYVLFLMFNNVYYKIVLFKTHVSCH